MKSGSEFTLLGSPHSGALYVEDEDNFGTYTPIGSQYNDDVDVYTRSGGVMCYTTSAYTEAPLYISTGGVYRPFSGTLYTRSNGKTRYETEKVDTELFRKGQPQSYTLYKPYTAAKLYKAGDKVTFNKAALTTKNVTALTV